MNKLVMSKSFPAYLILFYRLIEDIQSLHFNYTALYNGKDHHDQIEEVTRSFNRQKEHWSSENAFEHQFRQEIPPYGQAQESKVVIRG
jgi:hypothetical protein